MLPKARRRRRFAPAGDRIFSFTVKASQGRRGRDVSGIFDERLFSFLLGSDDSASLAERVFFWVFFFCYVFTCRVYVSVCSFSWLRWSWWGFCEARINISVNEMENWIPPSSICGSKFSWENLMPNSISFGWAEENPFRGSACEIFWSARTSTESCRTTAKKKYAFPSPSWRAVKFCNES